MFNQGKSVEKEIFLKNQGKSGTFLIRYYFVLKWSLSLFSIKNFN